MSTRQHRLSLLTVELLFILQDGAIWTRDAIQASLDISRDDFRELVQLTWSLGIQLGFYGYAKWGLATGEADRQVITTAILVGRRYNELRATGVDSWTCYGIITREFKSSKSSFTPQSVKQYGYEARKLMRG